eukprot:5887428-Prymnesium_polylepis.1
MAQQRVFVSWRPHTAVHGHGLSTRTVQPKPALQRKAQSTQTRIGKTEPLRVGSQSRYDHPDVTILDGCNEIGTQQDAEYQHWRQERDHKQEHCAQVLRRLSREEWQQDPPGALVNGLLGGDGNSLVVARAVSHGCDARAATVAGSPEAVVAVVTLAAMRRLPTFRAMSLIDDVVI